ncbi:MAG: hypothetical protein KJZ62_09755 [Fimbriimonadaceae bacterium]|nr:hypothetical protein [Fimbriimonadaceae bacterium]MCC6351661.1 hypothetical protein [Fimbriimonadaceae bacterium]MCL4285373.1 hypothetical protein [Fimbriimonadaceae bacterium]QOJ11915.1 MAG: hypothetical protein HRU74_07580 [Chthonomonadaceae bacterium]
MYLLSLHEDRSLIEASLGGRVTADEVSVLLDEIDEIVDQFESQGFSLLIDHSLAKTMDQHARAQLADLKDACLSRGAVKIVTVVASDEEVARNVNERFHWAMEGREQYVLDSSRIEWPATKVARTSLAA